MSPRFIKKLSVGSFLFAVMFINLVYFMALSFQGIFVQQKVPVLYTHKGSTPTSQLPQTTTLSPSMQKKIDQMKRDLNNTIREYPGRKVGRYLMVDPNLCNAADHLDVIIIVHTAPSNLERRQRIRDTFADASLFQPFQIRVAFLLGKTLNRTLERILWFEHVRYNDTVMGDFTDDYHNLSLKGVMGYHWVSQHCTNSDFVLKIDDDVLVNMFKFLYSFMNHMKGKKKSIFCNLWYKGTMPILRDGKWKVDPHVFNDQKTFPYDYCSGFLVVMTTDLMGPMFEASKITPFFWIDDIYLFGMLPSVVGGVTYYNYALDKNLTLIEEKAINCTRDQGPRCPIVATSITDKSYWSYWEMIKNIYISNTWNVDNKIVQ